MRLIKTDILLANNIAEICIMTTDIKDLVVQIILCTESAKLPLRSAYKDTYSM